MVLYVAYGNDGWPLITGTKEEVADYLGISPVTVENRSSPSYHRLCEDRPGRAVIERVRIDGEP